MKLNAKKRENEKGKRDAELKLNRKDKGNRRRREWFTLNAFNYDNLNFSPR